MLSVLTRSEKEAAKDQQATAAAAGTDVNDMNAEAKQSPKGISS